MVKGHISNSRHRLRPLSAAPLVLRRRNLIVVPRPLHAAPLDVRRRYLFVVPRSLPRCASQVLDRGAQTNFRGAAQILDRGVQAVARGAARCALHVHGCGARTVACGRGFAVLSTQVSTIGLRLRLVVPRPMPAAVALRWCRRRFPTWLAPRLTWQHA